MAEYDDRCYLEASNGVWESRTGSNVEVLPVNGKLGRVSTDKYDRKTDFAKGFNIRQIPDTMLKIGWWKSSALLNQWFDSPINQAQNIHQKVNGTGYPDDCINAKDLKLSWLLKFERARKGYDWISRPGVLGNTAALGAIRNSLLPYKNNIKFINTMRLCRNNMHDVHNLFQFQIKKVDTTLFEKGMTALRSELCISQPDDLNGVLGGFAFYAAILEATLTPVKTWSGIGKEVDASVTSVILYAKNPYSFWDDPTDGGSEYLGHWNTRGMILVPFSFIGSKEGNWAEDHDGVVFPHGKFGEAFWPIYNSDFRRWQDKNGTGRDRILYSDYNVLTLDKPIKVRLPR